MTEPSEEPRDPARADEGGAELPPRVLEVRIGPVSEGPDMADYLPELFDEIPGLGEMRALDAGERVNGLRRFSVTTTCSDEELLDLFSFHVERRLVQMGPLGDGDAGRALKATTLRVSVGKTDQLIQLVSKLVGTHALLVQGQGTLDPVDDQVLLSAIEVNGRCLRDLHDTLRSIRMAPVSVVFRRFPRMLRDLSGRLGKQVELVMVGEATEFDKALVEQLADTLTHLVRNACDHGIEPPDVRLRRGKAPHGTVTLSAWHDEGGAVVIEVRDDGRGLSQAHRVFDAHDLSGRGGLDVVKRTIAGLGGRFEVESVPGFGLSVQVRLPMARWSKVNLS
jgi:two-component system chemotaxis sensor kinase CheA